MMVSHGHITVNGRILNIPSYRVKKGEEVAIREISLALSLFEGLEARLKKIETPRWLNLDRSKKSGKMISLPEAEDQREIFAFAKVKEFYSR